MDIIIQGLIYDCVPQLISNFLATTFVSNVIVSTWEGQLLEIEDPRLIKIFNTDIELPGVGNRNRQIVSTQAGLGRVSTDVCAKFRSDQIFPVETLNYMNDFYNLHQTGEKIFVLGLYRNWPFHPRDHMFWGPTENMKILFDCPHDTWPYHGEYTQCLRAEAWIGAHYFAKHDDRAKTFIENHKEYLVDGAPKIDEAFLVDKELKHKLFHPFTHELKYSWPKVGISEYYWQHTYSDWSEYFHEHIDSMISS